MPILEKCAQCGGKKRFVSDTSIEICGTCRKKNAKESVSPANENAQLCNKCKDIIKMEGGASIVNNAAVTAENVQNPPTPPAAGWPAKDIDKT